MRIPEFRCGTKDELREHLASFSRNIGFSCFGFVIESKSRTERGSHNLHFIHNTSLGWKHAIEEALESETPHNLIRHATLHLPAVGWSVHGDVVGHTIVDDIAWSHVRRIKDWSYQSGITCPLSAPELEWGALVFLTDKVLSYDE